MRTAGAAINLIGDGDIAGIIQTVEAAETGIDMYIGIGGAPEGVLAASALRCIGGQMQGRLTALSEDERKRANAMGLLDLSPKYSIEQMATGDVIFAATGVTDGSLLRRCEILPRPRGNPHCHHARGDQDGTLAADPASRRREVFAF